MQRSNRASIEFSVNWQSQYAIHKERYFAGHINFWRDIFPGNMERHISALHGGDTYRESFGSGILVPPFEENRIMAFKDKQFERNQGRGTVTPRLGRFYPQGFAWTALKCYRANMSPFRLIKMDGDLFVADTNHPLASYPLTLEARYLEKPPGSIESHTGGCNDIAEMVTENGPSMQIPYPGIATDFYSVYPFRRRDEGDDSIFYNSPRLITHLDHRAIDQVESIYSRLLSSGSRILDLMSSWVSHLPDSLEDYEAIGLGLNETELATNRQLAGYVVHDLNQNPALPFEENEFDAVICTASIEYLTHPIEVIADVTRVTRQGGVFVTTFSDRWFPGKEILPWSEMHQFERLGLVLDFYRKAGGFDNLYTESVRGYPRPPDDRHIQETVVSDPIFAVWGKV